ncbi:rhodanese-like domain-containing protein [Shewanella sp. Isolate11]|uniref:rhodanese-like domain-containing protein n=1 Tax=Shewanella sp. Isolate11 TaxID=2908530 RepID=UPI001EFE5ED2|nr:rhodanese-like domain-containing protein [Shewanella sp. Isolate11]MCG9696279.1 rhodanese-like domain-containing protein [Shewanella sp. Isolate11]
MPLILNRVKSFIALLFIAALGFSSASFAKDEAGEIAWKMIDQGALVVDVRTPEEFSQGHLANAINIPYEQIAEEFTKRKIAKDTQVVLYCRSGRRSSIAQSSLVELGFSHTHNGGGYQQLTEQKPE